MEIEDIVQMIKSKCKPINAHRYAFDSDWLISERGINSLAREILGLINNRPEADNRKDS